MPLTCLKVLKQNDAIYKKPKSRLTRMPLTCLKVLKLDAARYTASSVLNPNAFNLFKGFETFEAAVLWLWWQDNPNAFNLFKGFETHYHVKQ